MGGPDTGRHGGRPPAASLARALLLVAFAAAMFLAGRLWSLREVREAQRAAGRAEEERLAMQAELNECRNALVLQRGPGRLP